MSNSQIPLSELPTCVDQIDTFLLAAEQQLKLLAEIQSEDELRAILQEYENRQEQITTAQQRLLVWQSDASASAYQQAEIKRSLGQLRRLALVTKNSIRIVREKLNLPDPERMQEEMQLQMMRMSVFFKS